MKPIDVLVVNPGLAVWGAELYLLNQVDALAERGVRLTLACPAATPLGVLWTERGLNHIELDVVKAAGLRRSDGSDRRAGARELLGDLGHSVGNIRRLAAVARRFDIIHSYSLNLHLDVAVLGKLIRRKTVLDLVNIVRPGVGRKVLRVAARLATLTVPNSTATSLPLEGVGRSTIIHPGIDLSRFAPGERDAELRRTLAHRPEDPIVGIFGRLDEPKGVHDLITAFTLLEGAAAKAQLVVVGERGTGPEAYTTELIRSGNELLGDRVRFLGRRSDIPELLRAVDIAVNASEAEPFGLNALEAQAVGTPIIGTNAGGIPEFVEHEVSGLLVEPGQPSQLAGAIERLVEDPELVASITATAKERVHPARGMEAQYDQLAGVYAELMARSAASSVR